MSPYKLGPRNAPTKSRVYGEVLEQVKALKAGESFYYPVNDLTYAKAVYTQQQIRRVCLSYATKDCKGTKRFGVRFIPLAGFDKSDQVYSKLQVKRFRKGDKGFRGDWANKNWNEKRRSPNPTKYPFSSLSIGEHFIVEIPEGRCPKAQKRVIQSALIQWKKVNSDKKTRFGLIPITDEANVMTGYFVCRTK